MSVSERRYTVCLPRFEHLLPELARGLGARYTPGSFTEAYELFYAGDADWEDWVLEGRYGRFTIRLEQYEGYLFAWLEADPEAYSDLAWLLWCRSLRAGVNPDALKLPE